MAVSEDALPSGLGSWNPMLAVAELFVEVPSL